MSRLFQKISLADLASNLESIVDQVHVSRTRLTITKNNHEVTQIVPFNDERFTLANLNPLLQRSTLSERERKAFADDLEIIRQTASLPKTPWD